MITRCLQLLNYSRIHPRTLQYCLLMCLWWETVLKVFQKSKYMISTLSSSSKMCDQMSSTSGSWVIHDLPGTKPCCSWERRLLFVRCFRNQDFLSNQWLHNFAHRCCYADWYVIRWVALLVFFVDWKNVLQLPRSWYIALYHETRE